MGAPLEIKHLCQLQREQEKVRQAARTTREKLKGLSGDPLEVLHTLRFERYGRHPWKDGELNLIEQLTQTFTAMASLAAARRLMKEEWFPQSGGLRLNLGATPGIDIEGIRQDVVEAEVFAAVNPKNNGKLKKDIDRMKESPAQNLYVFFYAPSCTPGRKSGLEVPDSRVQVWALCRREIM